MTILLILLVGIFLRFLFLQELPAEMWGDVIEHYKMVEDLLKGNFFLNYRFGGDGPFFTYASALIAKVIPLSFLSLKISSTLGGVLLIITAFYFTLELLKDTRMAYFVSFLSAISFWSLSFSRQAKPHIFVAFFALSALLFSLRKKDGLAGFFIGLGMYTQASFFGVPLLFLLLRKIKSLLIAAMISLPLVFSFL